MRKIYSIVRVSFFSLGFLWVSVAWAEPSIELSSAATEIIQKALDKWRGQTSKSAMTMTIKRPDWQRSISMQAWTQGEKHSLVQVTAPAKDAGNATLIKDKDMWTFAPKVNRVLKIPSSMMGQSWMGSDFSNKDVSRSTDIIHYYNHTLVSQEEKDGHTLYTIESIPHEDSPIVWGKEVLVIRDDYVLMSQTYYDQNMVPVKSMHTTEVANVGGRIIAKTMRMKKESESDSWTEMRINAADFDIDIPARIFTLSNLRNTRL